MSEKTTINQAEKNPNAKSFLKKMHVAIGILNDILLIPMFAAIILEMGGDAQPSGDMLLERSNLWFCASFFSEWIIGLILAPVRRAYCLSFTRILDLISTIPVGNAFQGLRLIRLTRVIKLVRVVLRAKRYQGPGKNLIRVLAVVGATTFAGAYTILLVEKNTEHAYCQPNSNAHYAVHRTGGVCPDNYERSGDYCLGKKPGLSLYLPKVEDELCTSGFVEKGSYCMERNPPVSADVLLRADVIPLLHSECPPDFERKSDVNIEGFGDALWWSLVTISTVGYGDHYPVTTGGRLVAVGLILIGVGVCGYIAGFMANLMAIGETSEELELMQRIETKLDKLAGHLEIEDWSYVHAKEDETFDDSED